MRNGPSVSYILLITGSRVGDCWDCGKCLTK